MTKVENPWQIAPSDLISHALQHLNHNKDSDIRVAYILLDAGVETILRTYLDLRPEITKTKLSHKERKQKPGERRNFFEITKLVERAAEHVLDGFNFLPVLSYHEDRNILYHGAKPMIPPREMTVAYAKIAVDLLNRLLDVDLTDQLPGNNTIVEASQLAREEKRMQGITEMRDAVGMEITHLNDLIWKAATVVNSQIDDGSFEGDFQDIMDDGASDSRIPSGDTHVLIAPPESQIENVVLYLEDVDVTKWRQGLIRAIGDYFEEPLPDEVIQKCADRIIAHVNELPELGYESMLLLIPLVQWHVNASGILSSVHDWFQVYYDANVSYSNVFAGGLRYGRWSGSSSFDSPAIDQVRAIQRDYLDQLNTIQDDIRLWLDTSDILAQK